MNKMKIVCLIIGICLTSCETKKDKMVKLINENIKNHEKIINLNQDKFKLTDGNLTRRIKLINAWGSDTTGLSKKLSSSVYQSDDQINYINKKINIIELKIKINDSLVSILEK